MQEIKLTIGSVLCLGDHSTGKSQVIHHVIEDARDRKVQMIASDSTGVLCKSHLRQGFDFAYFEEDLAGLDMGAEASYIKLFLADASDETLFIVSRANHHNFAPELTAMVDHTLREAVQMPRKDSGLLVILDDLTTLSRMPQMLSLSMRAQNLGIVVAAVSQCIEDVEAVYGVESAKVIFDSLHTKLCFRTKEPKSAGRLAEFLSHGISAIDVSTLPDLHCYKKTGDEPPTLLSISPVAYI